MGDLIDIHLADAVDGADQFLLHIPGEIAAVIKAKRAEREQKHDAVGIVARISRFAARVFAIRTLGRIGRRIDEMLPRGQTGNLHRRPNPIGILERNLIPRIDHDSLIALEVQILLTRPFPPLFKHTIVIHVADRNQRRQPRCAAEVIDVVVGHQEVVDFLQVRDVGSDVENPAGVALAGVAGVDEDRFIGGGDDEGGAAAFRVDPVDVQAMVGGGGEGAGDKEGLQEEGER